MKQNNIKDLPKIDGELLENIFNVYKQDGMYFYNLLQSIQFPENLPSNLFTTYKVVYGDTWPFISYKTLNSPNAWWIILMVNQITNPLAPLKPGDTILIPVENVVNEILLRLSK